MEWPITESEYNHPTWECNQLVIFPSSSLRPMQTDATSHNIVACCWGFLANNVASVCMGLNVWSVSNYTQQVSTLLWFHANGRNILGPTILRVVGQQCCVHLHGAFEERTWKPQFWGFIENVNVRVRIVSAFMGLQNWSFQFSPFTRFHTK